MRIVYRVVIIDDESIIVEGLQRVIDWKSYNCQVVATACDAVSGADIIRQCRPHIIFTDIKMPGADGLSMLAGLKAEFPKTQITVLTGYRDFEYAQKAIRLGVSRFLLKPSKMDELEEALVYMTGVLDTLPEEKTEISGKEDGSESANSFLVRQAAGLYCGALCLSAFASGSGRSLLRKPVVSVQAAAQASRDSFL